MSRHAAFLRFTSVLPVAVAVLAVLAFGAFHAGAAVSGGPVVVAPFADWADHDGRAVVEGSPAELLEAHGCWTGEAPADMAGVAPGHVVVSEPGSAARYAGPRVVGLALQQIFDGVDHDLVVHGFCR